jgi:hypothetical protein
MSGSSNSSEPLEDPGSPAGIVYGSVVCVTSAR